MLVMLSATGLIDPTHHKDLDTAPYACIDGIVRSCCTAMSDSVTTVARKTVSASVGQEACSGREACRVCADPSSLGRAEEEARQHSRCVAAVQGICGRAAASGPHLFS